MKLVDARAVQDLLTDNIDEHVSHYVIFTDHGTLLSHSHTLLNSALTKFTPFAGATWRNHNAQIAATGNTHLSIGGLPAMKTLDFEMKKDADGSGVLKQITVEMEGMVSVIRLVVPRLLVTAQSESGKFRKEGDEVGRRVEGLDLVDESGDEIASSAGSQDDSDEDEADEGRAEDQSSSSDGRTSSDQKRPSKMRILELKAEGMAESLANDYPDKLPHDFY